MSQIGIWKVRQSDAPPIARILRELGWFKHLCSETDHQSVACIEQHIALCTADECHSVYVAATQEHKVVGYSAVHWLPYLFLSRPEGYLSELFILADYRGLGIGEALLEVIAKEAHERGCSRLMLVNSRSRDSYQRSFIPS